MNKVLKRLIPLILLNFSIQTLSYSQKTDMLFTSIEEHKSYIFAKYLEPLNKPKKTNDQYDLLNPGQFQKEELPIFCKMEFLIHQKSQFPVKIRLGDIQYVDMLESKSIFKH